MKKMMAIPTPCASEVEKYLEQYRTSEKLQHYRIQEEVLQKLREITPSNTVESEVLLKVTALNQFYSTNIFAVYDMAKHIVALNIDERLKKGDETLVNEIATVEIGGKQRSFYSFATKYCVLHNPTDFAIYDSKVERVLQHFRKQDKFSTFSKDDLRNYPEFKRILLDFRRFYQLENYSLRDFDRYLWLLGKAYF